MSLLMYKFGQSGYPKYLEPFLTPRHSVFYSRKSQAHCVLLKATHFVSSVYKFNKHFSFEHLKIWNDLPHDDVRLVTSFYSFRKELKSCLFAKAYPP